MTLWKRASSLFLKSAKEDSSSCVETLSSCLLALSFIDANNGLSLFWWVSTNSSWIERPQWSFLPRSFSLFKIRKLLGIYSVQRKGCKRPLSINITVLSAKASLELKLEMDPKGKKN